MNCVPRQWGNTVEERETNDMSEGRKKEFFFVGWKTAKNFDRDLERKSILCVVYDRMQMELSVS